MRRVLLIILLTLVAGSATFTGWWLMHRPSPTREFMLYGSIEMRQVELAFTGSERISAVLVEEGDCVKRGQVVARLDRSRLETQLAQADAQVIAVQHIVEKLRNGSRPEEIAQGRANLESARTEATRARQQHERLGGLSQRSEGRAVSQQDLDNIRAVQDVAEARFIAAQESLELLIAGPRKEDIAEAEARLRVAEAQLAFVRHTLEETELVTPADGVVSTRIMEPGEIAFPQRPIISLAITDPKWVRAFVSEPDLGRVRPGMAVSVAADSFPNRRFDAWVGFISPVAEFTPKAVQTEDLRTSLVYEVRVFVKDPSDDLRLGMPATVYLPVPQASAAASSSASAAQAPTSASAEERTR